MLETGQSTGARLVLDVLADEGVETSSGIPAARSCRCTMPCSGTGAPRSDPSRSGRRLRGRRVRAFDRPGRRCVATSGPGATNLITGLLDAQMDSIPLVAITGQVRTGVMGTDAFQEADVASIAGPVTKRSVCVRDVADLKRTLRAAFRVARGPRPGPVLVWTSRKTSESAVARLESVRRATGRQRAAAARRCGARRSDRAVRRAERPVAIAGGGVRSAGATHLFRNSARSWVCRTRPRSTASAARRPATRAFSECWECTAGRRRTSPSPRPTSCSRSACVSTTG